MTEGQIERWADAAQFHAEEAHDWDEKVGVPPKVTLIWMTPDPLGALASFNQMYIGNVIRRLDDVTDEMRRKALDDMQKTHLQAPLENIKVQFLFEGGDRAFQQQLTRQRTAVYAIESLRFAVKGALGHNTTLPPDLLGTVQDLIEDDEFQDISLVDLMDRGQYLADEHKKRLKWEYALATVDAVYHQLVNDGMPAEEARGLLPLATAGPIQMTTDMRNLIAHSGNRLCTQAQFHWRSFFYQIVMSIRNACSAGGHRPGHDDPSGPMYDFEKPENFWQYQAIAEAKMFQPICYQTGKCEFKGSADRACSIRDRVDQFAYHGVSSDKWDFPNIVTVRHHSEGQRGEEITIPAIRTEEWLVDPAAARTTVPKGL